MYTLYVHITPCDPVPRMYLGVTKQKPEQRWNHGEGYRHSSRFYEQVKKYGWDNIRHLIIDEGLTQEEAYEEEKDLIKRMRLTELGWNIAPGGAEPWNKGKTGVYKPEALERMRVAKLGNQNARKRKGA